MMTLADLQIVASVGSPIVAIVGAGYLVWYRLGRIEHILSNANGLVQRVEHVERDQAVMARLCEERHTADHG
jgi:hypothetical protein